MMMTERIGGTTMMIGTKNEKWRRGAVTVKNVLRPFAKQ
jgi:hypothetical protein